MENALTKLLTTLGVCLLVSGCIDSSRVKLPIPDTVDRSKASPWNFYDDFSSKSLTWYVKHRTPGYTKVKPYDFVEVDGNTALAITATDLGSDRTERAELSVPLGTRTLGKEVWYGFRVKAAPDYQPIEDRLLFTQFKHQINSCMKPSPMLGMRAMENQELTIGGVVFGLPNEGCKRINGKRYHSEIQPSVSYYLPGLSSEEVANTGWPTTANVRVKRGYYEQLELADGYQPEEWNLKGYSTELKPPFNKKTWTTYVIGASISREDDGWIQIFQDGKSIYKYSGVTLGWRPQDGYYESVIRIGIYRDRIPGQPYPDQTLYFDDFAIGSTKGVVVSAMGIRALPKKVEPVARLTIKPSMGDPLTLETFECGLTQLATEERTVLGWKVFDQLRLDLASNELTSAVVPVSTKRVDGVLEQVEGEPVMDSVAIAPGVNQLRVGGVPATVTYAVGGDCPN